MLCNKELIILGVFGIAFECVVMKNCAVEYKMLLCNVVGKF